MRAGTMLFLGALAMSIGACAETTPPPVPGHAELDDSFAALRDAFNAGRGRVRLLFVVDPVCPMCLKGLADIDDALLAKTTDSRLDTHVVHVPVIGGTAEDVAPAAELLHNDRVRHYWNESGRFGGRLSVAANLSDGDEFIYAWDVWLIYGPDAVWEGQDPPKPDVLMHQLPALRGRAEYLRLDGEAFARAVHERLDRMPQAAP